MEAWQEKLDAVNISKEDLNCLVLNFLVIEGYKDTAEKFAKESCTKADVDLNSIGDRMQIRAAVHHGNIADAIERVNDLNPEILETNVGLLFKLQQQRLIEMIREGKVQEALGFVQEELLTLCENNSVCLSMYNVGKLKMVVKDLLFELETTLSLLAFENLSTQGADFGADDGGSMKRVRDFAVLIVIMQNSSCLPSSSSFSSLPSGTRQRRA